MMYKQIDKQLLNLAFSGLQIGIAVYDSDGKMKAHNDLFGELSENFSHSDSLVSQLMEDRQPRKELHEVADGMFVESVVVPMTNEQGETEGYICYLSDVTEREAMIEALKLAKEEVIEDVRLEDIFINNLNHEIRTPLNAIIGFNDVLNGVAGQHMEEDEKLKIKNHIHKNADRLITLINDILDYSKMEKGSAEVHKSVVRLMEVCCKARDSVRPEVQKGVKLEHEYPVALQDTMIYTDGKRLEKLLRNLLYNACKHTPAGSVKLIVETFTDEFDGSSMLRFKVNDTGVGIPIEKRHQLFTPFSKLNEAQGGLGIGLALCKQIAKMLDGHIFHDHEYHGGSSFVFEMPLDEMK